MQFWEDAKHVELLETKSVYTINKIGVVKLSCKCAAHLVLLRITTIQPGEEPKTKEITYSGAYLIHWKR